MLLTLTRVSFVILTLMMTLIAFVGIAHAEESTTETSATSPTPYQETTPPPRPTPEPRPYLNLDRREDVRDRREDVRDRREDVRDVREDRVDALRDTGPADRREDVRDRREDVRDRVEDVRDRTEDRREALRAQGLENAADRIVVNVRRMVAVLEAGANRLQGLTRRIESRLNTLEETGTDTAPARAFLLEAQTALSSAYLKIADIQGETANLTPGNARDTFARVRALIIETRDLLQEASRAIRETVQELKKATGAGGATTEQTPGE